MVLDSLRLRLKRSLNRPGRSTALGSLPLQGPILKKNHTQGALESRLLRRVCGLMLLLLLQLSSQLVAPLAARWGIKDCTVLKTAPHSGHRSVFFFVSSVSSRGLESRCLLKGFCFRFLGFSLSRIYINCHHFCAEIKRLLMKDT